MTVVFESTVPVNNHSISVEMAPNLCPHRLFWPLSKSQRSSPLLLPPLPAQPGRSAGPPPSRPRCRQACSASGCLFHHFSLCCLVPGCLPPPPCLDWCLPARFHFSHLQLCFPPTVLAVQSGLDPTRRFYLPHNCCATLPLPFRRPHRPRYPRLTPGVTRPWMCEATRCISSL